MQKKFHGCKKVEKHCDKLLSSNSLSFQIYVKSSMAVIRSANINDSANANNKNANDFHILKY